MKEVLDGVFVVESNGRKGYGYNHFVRRPSGNLVLDAGRVGLMTDSFADLADAGGVAAILISDRHLGDRKTDEIREHFNAPTYASEIEAKAMAHRAKVDHALPFERQTILGDVRLIPTPGHTPGQFTALFEVGGARCLFTSDFCYRVGGRWRPGNLSRKVMRASFEGLKDLQFDYVVPWSDYDTDEFFVPVRGSIPDLIDEMFAGCERP